MHARRQLTGWQLVVHHIAKLSASFLLKQIKDVLLGMNAFPLLSSLFDPRTCMRDSEQLLSLFFFFSFFLFNGKRWKCGTKEASFAISHSTVQLVTQTSFLRRYSVLATHTYVERVL